MTTYRPMHSAYARLKRSLMLLAYPGLKAFPASEWQSALQRARDIPMDVLEWLGVIAAVAVVTWMLRDLTPVSGITAAATQNVIRFFLAIPLLGLLAGPFLLRRTRRGIEIVRHQREAEFHSARVSHGGKS